MCHLWALFFYIHLSQNHHYVGDVSLWNGLNRSIFIRFLYDNKAARFITTKLNKIRISSFFFLFLKYNKIKIQWRKFTQDTLESFIYWIKRYDNNNNKNYFKYRLFNSRYQITILLLLRKFEKKKIKMAKRQHHHHEHTVWR